MKNDPTCVQLECNWNSMDIQFSSHLFGSPSPPASPMLTTSNPDRKPIASLGKWSLSCPLGKCGMSVSTRVINRETHLVFAYSIFYGIETESVSVEVDAFDVYLHNPSTTSVKFECAYRTDVKVSSGALNVHAIDAAHKATKFGSLANGFSLNLFTDRSMNIPVQTENLYIGRSVYAAVDWQVSALSHLVNFYVDSCEIEFDDKKSLQIIENNCYARTFGTKQLQKEKVVSKSSRFQFTSFIVGHGARSMKMQMTCSVKICSVTENKCQHNLSVTDTDCTSTKGYAYKAQTYTQP